jgi:hypothetical protein
MLSVSTVPNLGGRRRRWALVVQRLGAGDVTFLEQNLGHERQIR